MLEMWGVGVVGRSGCGLFGMWDIRGVGCSECEMFGICGCWMFRMWDVRDVGSLEFGMWDVGCLPGCGMLIYKKPFLIVVQRQNISLVTQLCL